jgi:mRNA guanylyltransferase
MLEERDFPVIPGELMPEPIAHELQQHINALVGRRGTHFVGSQPVSFEAKHIPENLEKRDYFVCEKSDGLRCLMFCILDPNGDEAVFLITRENQFYRVPNFHFPLPGDENSCHNGTLIDGELVLSKRPTDGVKELRYLMFDCLALNGKNIVMKPLQNRLGYLDIQFFRPYYKLREQHPAECESFPFKLNLKNMQMSYKLPKVLDSLKFLGHVSDGLIFTCCETPYMFGTDHTLLKWKPSEENTVDFRLHLGIPLYIDEDLDERDPDRVYPNYEAKPQLELHVWHGDNNGVSSYSHFAQLQCTDEEWDKLKSLDAPLEERIVECNKDSEDHWRLLRFRDDKANGNHVTIVKKVLKSIQDAVSKEQLIQISPEIERCWKERETRKRHREHQEQHPRNHAQQYEDQESKRKHEEEPGYVEDSDDEEEQGAKRARVD